MTSRTIEKPGPGVPAPETGQVADPSGPATGSVAERVRQAIEAVQGKQYVGEAASQLLPANVQIPMPNIEGITWVWVRTPVECYLTPYKQLPKYRVRSSGFSGLYDHMAEDIAGEAMRPDLTLGTEPGDLMRYGLADRSMSLEEEITGLLSMEPVWQPMSEDEGPVTEDWAMFSVDVTGISPALLPDSITYDDGHPDRVIAVWWLAALVLVGTALRAVYQLQEVR